MARKANLHQMRAGRKACSITITLLACALIYVNAAFAAGPKAYVGNFKDNTISVIDLELKRATATIAGPARSSRHGDHAR